MGHTVRVRQGGEVTAVWWDVTAQAPVFDEDRVTALIRGGGRIANGEASTSEFTYHDTDNDAPNPTQSTSFLAHNVVEWFDDAPGYDCMLSTGRIAFSEAGRGDDDWGTPQTARTWKVSYDDANSHLHGLTFDEDHTRPEETDVARVLWAMGAFAAGTASTEYNADPNLSEARATTDITAATDHLVKATPTVTMPAKTYEAGSSDLLEVLNDCATAAGRIYGVTRHHQSSATHLCFLYIDETDHDTYRSALRISDDADDHDFEGLVSSPSTPTFGTAVKGSTHNDDTLDASLTVGTATNPAIFAFVNSQPITTDVRWYPNTSSGGFESFTKLADDIVVVDASVTMRASIWRLESPTPTVAGSFVRAVQSGNTAGFLQAQLWYDVDPDNPEDGVLIESGAGTASAITTITTSSSQDAINFAGWMEKDASGIVDPVAGGGQTEAIVDSFNNSAGRADGAMGAGYGSDDPTWDWGASRTWVGVGLAVNGFGQALTFPPIWDIGPAFEEEGQHISSKVVSRWSGGTIIASLGTAQTDIYDFWSTSYNDSESVNAAQGTARANAILAERKFAHVTNNVTVRLPAYLTDIVSEGQTVQLKAAAALGGHHLGDFQDRRVVSLQWEPVNPGGTADRFYYAHMQLDRPQYKSGAGAFGGASSGQQAAAETAQDLTDHAADPDAHHDLLTVEEGDGAPSVAAVETIVFDEEDFSVTDSGGGTATIAFIGSGGTASNSIIVQEDGSTEGTATTLNFTTNMDLSFSGGTATISSTGGGGDGYGAFYDPARPPTSGTNAATDEFNDESLNVAWAWTAAGTPSATVSESVYPGWLHFDGGSNATAGDMFLARSFAPGGSTAFSVATRVRYSVVNGNFSGGIGIGVLDASDALIANTRLYTDGTSTASNGYRLFYGSTTIGSSWSTMTDAMAMQDVWLLMTRDTSDNYVFYFSGTGGVGNWNWMQTLASGTTVQKVAIIFGGDTDTFVEAAVDFVRVFDAVTKKIGEEAA